MVWSRPWAAAPSARGRREDPEVLLLEIGTGQLLQVPVPFSRFHDEELVEQTEAALAKSFYERWRASGGAAPGLTRCVGYRVPLFLGGADEVTNLELSDLDVYWSLTGQLRPQAQGLQPGTTITGVGLDDA